MNSLDQILSTQKIRVFDVYALGPFMVWYAMRSKDMGAWPRRALFVSGVYTIIYNWKNYKAAEAALAEKVQAIL